jgi:hypothetical protein
MRIPIALRHDQRADEERIQANKRRGVETLQST